jgi:hypothetical protein
MKKQTSWTVAQHNDGTEEDVVTINPQDFQFSSKPQSSSCEIAEGDVDADIDFGFDLDTKYKRMCSDLRQAIVKFG